MASPDKKLTKEKIESFLRKTGFVFEMEVAEYLKNTGWAIDTGSMFFDLEDEKKREIDILATKTINKVKVHLVIECKQSLMDDWVFIKTKERPPMYYHAVKHLPQIDLPSKKKPWALGEIHYFDSRHLICQNYIAVDRNEKSSNTLVIRESLLKLPKAVIDLASAAQSENRNLFFPILCFSGQIFCAEYDKTLNVKRENFVQYCSEFESEAYKKPRQARSLSYSSEDPWEFFDSKKSKIKLIKNTAENLRKYQTIDIVSFQGIKPFLHRLEAGVEKTPWRKWNLKPRKKHTAG